ncbi:putative nucleotide-binding protein containing TIR-like domain protein [Novipirellula galeiformis]|uniref:Putative nucleotide-binding protein containing TIR-like domain protein n=1 Tax=Novipirellula galeiformis TaxID=2528004 RepID=A0A5C6CK33_9BACT|nr:nucleotide-binding protein [Novipirellula galeiformis]TWU23466.1 putative nucleotide-binding protein containing TIR-like domain protein [Novipirellula galeiformis]
MNKTSTDDATYIEQLEDYKTALMAYSLGHDKLDGGTSIRTYINRNTPSVRKLVWRAGCGKTITVGPPAMVGGLIMRNVDPFGCIFEGPYGMNMTSVLCDMIDETVGVIQAGELRPEPKPKPKSNATLASPKSNRKVFVVHGHDNETKQTVARFLENLGLEAVILHERSSGGMTLIEKFEEHSDVAYAVVLMTPDDLGAAKAKVDKLNARARQNVVFELGYFMGKLGRKHVAAILRGDIERPSDYDGIVYIAYDFNDGWKLLLAKELKEAGLDVDLNEAM